MNEVFTITDSLVWGGYAQSNSSFDVLMGISPLKFVNSLSAGLSLNRINLRQISIQRTKQGVQVYLRKQNQNLLSASVNANYFLNVLKFSGMGHQTSGDTSAFLIDYEPGMSSVIKDADPTKATLDFTKTRNDLRIALLPLLKEGETELLQSKFQHRKVELTHDWSGSQFAGQVMAWKASDYQEGHKVSFLLPASSKHPELKPEAERITLYSHARGELKGRDLLGLGMDFISSWIRYKNPKSLINLGGGLDPNPANTPFGKAYWRLINAEADLSVSKQLKSVAKIENVWGGWDLDREEFLALIAEIEKKLNGQGLVNYKLLPPEKFAHVKSVDFYRITATLSLLPASYDRIRDLVLLPPSIKRPCRREDFLANLFKKLSIVLGHGYQPQEMDLFEQLLLVYGEGNRTKGWERYTKICKEDWDQKGGMPPGFWRNGNNYECLSPWMDSLMNLSQQKPTNKEEEAEWISAVVKILDDHIPRQVLLKYLGPTNYAFSVRVNGFRTGDEDGDLQIISNTLGDPADHIEYANGLFQKYATDLGINPMELARSIVGYK